MYLIMNMFEEYHQLFVQYNILVLFLVNQIG